MLAKLRASASRCCAASPAKSLRGTRPSGLPSTRGPVGSYDSPSASSAIGTRTRQPAASTTRSSAPPLVATAPASSSTLLPSSKRCTIARVVTLARSLRATNSESRSPRQPVGGSVQCAQLSAVGNDSTAMRSPCMPTSAMATPAAPGVALGTVAIGSLASAAPNSGAPPFTTTYPRGRSARGAAIAGSGCAGVPVSVPAITGVGCGTGVSSARSQASTHDASNSTPRRHHGRAAPSCVAVMTEL